jgi:hypothetical protein
MKRLFIPVVLVFMMAGCSMETFNSKNNLNLNETIELIYGKTYQNYEKNVSIKLDSVLEDSRCPENVECFWAGMAIARFDFTLNNKLTTFFLTNTGGTAGDTIISGYKIQFISLNPYPVYGIPINIKDYIAGIKISI